MLLERAGVDSDTVVTLARTRGPVRCAKGMRVLPDLTIDDHPPLDVVLVPGGHGTRALVDDTDLLAWLAAVGVDARWVTSVCTGSLVLWASGLAKNKRVATHWSFEDELARLGDVRVVRDARWVRHGKVVTSQGVSAGIDMALWLVGQLHDASHARATQRYLQYDPAPPYAADV
jgi:transcriptional regulator GlxA family with amidase domain